MSEENVKIQLQRIRLRKLQCQRHLQMLERKLAGNPSDSWTRKELDRTQELLEKLEAKEQNLLKPKDIITNEATMSEAEQKANQKLKPKILVADDDPAILHIISLNLEAQNYSVVTATNGTEAIRKAILEKPDLIILDVIMPETDGYEVLHTLKNAPETENIPILVLTAYASEMGAVVSWTEGADGYLAKPFDTEELLSLVKKLLEVKENLE